MWEQISRPWQVCFEQAWESYCNGSIPIGAVLVDNEENIIYCGRNRVNEKTGLGKQISYNKLAHAEMNTLLQINIDEHPNIRKYTLYTTMEPCPLCFGAIVMSNIRKLKYAARDRVGGGTNLNNANEFISGKSIVISGPETSLEEIQIVIKTDFVLRAWGEHAESLLQAWYKDCPRGVTLGRNLFKESRLEHEKDKGTHISVIFNEIEKAMHMDK